MESRLQLREVGGGRREGGGDNRGRSSKPGCDGEGHTDGDRFPPEVDRCHVCSRQLHTR